MDTLKKLGRDLTIYSFFWLLITNLMGIATFLVCFNLLKLNLGITIIFSSVVAFGTSYGAAKLIVLACTQPLKAIWQALWHISPSGTTVSAPNVDALTHGRDLADSLIRQIYSLYEISSKQSSTENSNDTTLQKTSDVIFEHIPIAIIGLDKNGNISICNKYACDYIGLGIDQCNGKAFNDVAKLSFQSGETIDDWLIRTRQNSATATNSWDRVRLTLPEEKGIKQFDLIARYSKDDPNNYEVMLALFDHTDKYSSEDNSTAYVALAVHELRTPLTLLRGYIEVFEDELDDKLTPELKDFMHKMSASAQTLTAFVSNILNVARVDENQLKLSLHEANWNELLPQFAKDLELRAHVRGKNIALNITPNLPTVAVDKVSIYEVISNLVENAIKYSDDGSTITIHARLNKEGDVETIVQDHGIGMPESAVSHLFTKFYRSHRSKSKIGGSGLGLYIVKAFVSAHGGQVWVQSREGEGSSFGFTLKPFASISSELNGSTDGSIEREAHGWIKNHSMYRR